MVMVATFADMVTCDDEFLNVVEKYCVREKVELELEL